MGTIKIDFDVRIINNEDYIPFKQVMKLLRNLDKHTPNIDLHEITTQLEQSRDEARANL